MKIFFLISALLMAPLSFASYHGGEEGGGSNPTNNSSGGYGGSDGLAIAGVIALVGGLAYYFTRGTKEEGENSDGLSNQNSFGSKKFEIDFKNYDLNYEYDSFLSSGPMNPRDDFKINFRYKLQ